MKYRLGHVNVVFTSTCTLVIIVSSLSPLGLGGAEVLMILVGMLVCSMSDLFCQLGYPIWVLSSTLIFALPAYVVLHVGRIWFPNWLTSTLMLAWFGGYIWAYFALSTLREIGH